MQCKIHVACVESQEGVCLMQIEWQYEEQTLLPTLLVWIEYHCTDPVVHGTKEPNKLIEGDEQECYEYFQNDEETTIEGSSIAGLPLQGIADLKKLKTVLVLEAVSSRKGHK